jgi:replicative DNA helicase
MDLTSLNKDRKARRREKVDMSNMIYGKVPPQATDLEKAVLGAIMLERDAIDVAQELLKPEMFYVDAHQRIYSSFIDLNSQSQPVDILTVVECLRKKQELEMVGGPYYITQLTNSVVSSANIEAHSRIIMQKFIQREVIRIGGQMIVQAYEDSTDAFELLDDVEAQVMGITLSNLKKDFSAIDQGLVKVVQQIEVLRQKDESLTGVPSGFKSIDDITHGWQNTDLIILAARPSVGKTAFALNLARNAALHSYKPTPVGFFSLEMSESQLVQRILSAESEIWLEKIRNGRLEDEHMKQLYQKGIARLAQAPIFIDDTAAITMFELRAKARRMVKKYKVGLIIIDYLQLMTGDSGDSKNREREIAKISRELKKLAKDLSIPIIALSQLSRAIESRANKEPQLSDLRESGAIEQDADLVMFLYRPADDDVKKDGELRNKGMIKIAKHRNGTLDEKVLKFYGAIQKWMDLDDADRFETGSTWKPVTIPKENYRDYTEPVKDEDEGLPF